MFTGLIEDVGVIRSVARGSQDWLVSIHSDVILETVRLGDSVAVNGACLTVIAKDSASFHVQVSRETVASTTFAKLAAGVHVNLERALLVGGRLDGHWVQGHVDVVGKVERLTPRGESTEIWFRVAGGVGRYIMAKGSIALDGVSLTVNDVKDAGDVTRFSVNMIPHTRKKTTLAEWVSGQDVNVETDLLGRYVDRLLKSSHRGGQGINEAFLREKGF